VVQDTFEKESVLEKLVHKVPMSEWEPGTQKAAHIAHARRIPESAAAIYLKDLYELTLPVGNKATSFAEQMTRLVQQVMCS
jgi:hypothetical protein